MNYNINDIMPYIKNYDFGEYFTAREEDFLVSSVDCDDDLEFDWDCGATKMVVIPENMDYVIKIPFNGYYDEFEKKYYEYCYSQNYCENEIELYNEIFKENPLFAQFFLPLTRVEEFREWDVYIQPKCQIYNNMDYFERSNSYSKASLIKIKSDDVLNCAGLPDDWLAAVAEVLDDIELVKKFINFLESHNITEDLHRCNIGYYEDKPVILDYAGYYDDF